MPIHRNATALRFFPSQQQPSHRCAWERRAIDSPHHSALGYTLLELVITLAIIAITVTIGFPAVHELVRDHRRTTTANALATDLNFARNIAIASGRTVFVCHSDDGAHCIDQAPDTRWAKGWLVTVDPTGTNAAPLRSHVAQGGTPDVYRRQGLSNAHIISFRPDGTTPHSGRFELCDGRGPDHARVITNNAAGRIYISNRRSGGLAPDCDH